MATAMAKGKNKTPLKEPQFSWDEDEYALLNKGVPIFECYPNETSCCGLMELSEFHFRGSQLRYTEELQKSFNTIKANNSESKILLVTTRNHTTKELLQPAWFMKCLENFPGAQHDDWRKNNNTENDIQVWILPV